jgi:hypothetical protein
MLVPSRSQHPFFSGYGLKACSPTASAAASPHLVTPRLRTGDYGGGAWPGCAAADEIARDAGVDLATGARARGPGSMP